MRIVSGLMLIFGVASLLASFGGLMSAEHWSDGLVFFVPLSTAGVTLLLWAGWLWHKASCLDLLMPNSGAEKLRSRAQLRKGRLIYMGVFLLLGLALTVIVIRLIGGP
jgi:multisubunit Na+/H+ antiporter MnhF subunit